MQLTKARNDYMTEGENPCRCNPGRSVFHASNSRKKLLQPEQFSVSERCVDCCEAVGGLDEFCVDAYHPAYPAELPHSQSPPVLRFGLSEFLNYRIKEKSNMNAVGADQPAMTARMRRLAAQCEMHR